MVIKHYSFNGMTIAVRRGGVLRYTHTDHLGSSSGQTDTSGAAIAASYLRYHAYGTLRSGDPSQSSTDRTFTGQKSDGTGLLYYNARYYDPGLGTFISPDTLVPDAGRVVDYNRFLYVRANPLKYNDPSGHCALLDNGSADRDGDGACWDAADEWYATFGGGDYSQEEWYRNFGGSASITEDVLRAGLYKYWSPLYQQWGVHHQHYNPLPQWHEPPPPPNPADYALGGGLVTTVGRDIYACTESLADCGNALDGLSTTLSGVAMGCLVAGFVPCAGVAEVSGDVIDLIGVGLTTYTVANGKDSHPDLIVAAGGTWISRKYGDIGYGVVGFGISVLQWIYGHWE